MIGIQRRTDQPETQPEALPRAGLLSSLHRTRLVRRAVDALFPPACQHCGRFDTRWCEMCAVRLATEPLDANVYALVPCAALAVTSPHTGMVRDAVLALKFGQTDELAEALGARLAAATAALGWRMDAVHAVPLHAVRERRRGYNQAALLAQAAARLLDLPYTAGITRIRNTPAQVGLNAQERRVNMDAAFSAPSGHFAGQTLLLIDDVTTTGATLAACAEAALAAGAARVYGLTVTSAVFRPTQNQ